MFYLRSIKMTSLYGHMCLLCLVLSTYSVAVAVRDTRNVNLLELAVGATIKLNCSANRFTASQANFCVDGFTVQSMFYQQMILSGNLFQETTAIGDTEFSNRISPYSLGAIGIDRSRISDSRLYVCIISNFSQNYTTQWDVTVVDRPKKPKVKLPKRAVWETRNATVRFGCSSKGSRGTLIYNWIKGTGDLPRSRHKVNHSTGQLIIYNAQRTDRGRYRCSVENVAGLTVSDDVYLKKIYYTPKTVTLTSKPKPGVVGENTPVTLNCKVDDCNPAPRLNILMRSPHQQTDDVKLYESTTAVKQVSAIVNITREHNGRNLYCQATWDISSYLGNPIGSKKMMFDIKYPHDVEVKATRYILDEGDDTQLTCYSRNGNPDVITSRKWTFTSKSDNQREVLLSVKGRKLVLKRISPLEAGRYTCEVSNGIGGTNRDSIDIIVHYKEYNFTLLVFDNGTEPLKPLTVNDNEGYTPHILIIIVLSGLVMLVVVTVVVVKIIIKVRRKQGVAEMIQRLPPSREILHGETFAGFRTPQSGISESEPVYLSLSDLSTIQDDSISHTTSQEVKPTTTSEADLGNEDSLTSDFSDVEEEFNKDEYIEPDGGSQPLPHVSDHGLPQEDAYANVIRQCHQVESEDVYHQAGGNLGDKMSSHQCQQNIGVNTHHEVQPEVGGMTYATLTAANKDLSQIPTYLTVNDMPRERIRSSTL